MFRGDHQHVAAVFPRLEAKVAVLVVKRIPRHVNLTVWFGLFEQRPPDARSVAVYADKVGLRRSISKRLLLRTAVRQFDNSISNKTNKWVSDYVGFNVPPNQQCQSTEGTTPPCYNNTTLGNRLYAQRKGPNVTNPISWTCKKCSHKCAADCKHCVTQSSTELFW